ncbi:MAG: hypothetical protein L0Z50_16940, partial [Verrucomicrobiales bacterium]|nr:hypothetical protein [Verrucomicrobiales bacterium]
KVPNNENSHLFQGGDYVGYVSLAIGVVLWVLSVLMAPAVEQAREKLNHAREVRDSIPAKLNTSDPWLADLRTPARVKAEPAVLGAEMDYDSAKGTYDLIRNSARITSLGGVIALLTWWIGTRQRRTALPPVIAHASLSAHSTALGSTVPTLMSIEKCSGCGELLSLEEVAEWQRDFQAVGNQYVCARCRRFLPCVQTGEELDSLGMNIDERKECAPKSNLQVGLG